MRLGSLRLSLRRRGLGVSAALLLATAALAGLSIQSVYREAQVRRRLISDTHRSIADVASARLDAAMQDADRAVAGEIQTVKPQTQTLLNKFQELEGSRPWLQPLVLVSSSRPDSNPQAVSLDGFENLFAAAERAEFRERLRDAAALYAKGVSAAGTGIQRAKALNGEARSELKAGDPLRAAEAYKKFIDETETLDSEQARLSVIARDQLVVCYRLLQDTANFRSAVLDLYQFLVAHRFILDDDTYAFSQLLISAYRKVAASDEDLRSLLLLERKRRLRRVVPGEAFVTPVCDTWITSYWDQPAH